MDASKLTARDLRGLARELPSVAARLDAAIAARTSS